MKLINGGVCAAKGFTASGVHCGIRKNRTKKDVALIYSECPASAAAVYTTNLVKGAPLAVTKRNIANGIAQAVICNSGNANTCNAGGELVAEEIRKSRMPGTLEPLQAEEMFEAIAREAAAVDRGNDQACISFSSVEK